DADDVLLMIAQRARHMSKADVAVIVGPDPSGRQLAVRTVSGEGAERMGERSVAVEGSLVGRAYVSGEPVATDLSHVGPHSAPLLCGMGIGPVLLVPLGQ